MRVLFFLYYVLKIATESSLLYSVLKRKTAQGLSRKTQELLFLANAIGALRLFVGTYSFQVILLEVISALIPFAMFCLLKFRSAFRASYDPIIDNLQYHIKILPACLLLGLMCIQNEFIDLLWFLPMWLECFAILPQYFVMIRRKDISNIPKLFPWGTILIKIVFFADLLASETQPTNDVILMYLLSSFLYTVLHGFFLRAYIQISSGKSTKEYASVAQVAK
mmetsp:Transcript_51601/g.59015  ORF Transcript_51601/g.59015 Transcript_51601/m.59015 type:complete len:222 (+) Transcript_51601:58-723(+)